MSKFGNLISQAKGRPPESEGAGIKGNFDKVDSGKVENNKSGKPEGDKNRKPENQNQEEKSVNLSIKVPESLRRHWVAEAKRSGTSITAEVTEALNKKFGSPY
jgi:predicted HicB family RNase H-like nuclease